MQKQILFKTSGSWSSSLSGKLKAKVFGRPIRLEGPDMEEDSRLTVFDLETLKKAIGNFSHCNKLGHGGFSRVYKGTLRDGKEIAVTRFSLNEEREFLLEVKLAAKLQHKNLVHIIGYCAEGSERLIVYEYLPNKSLDKLLFGESYPLLNQLLDWEMRFNIILGIARGLVYLHEDSLERIIHRNIKASNILLDHRMNPKITGFGLARLIGEDDSHVSTTVAGTRGYLDPEYFRTGHSTVKADVYDFGVLLLEILCGRMNCISPENEFLVELVWTSFERGHAADVIDTKIVGKCGEEEVMRCIHVGLLCIQTDLSLRPSISSVYSMLSNSVMNNLPHPIKPWKSESMSSDYKDSEKERQDTHKSLPLNATSNLTDNEIIEMKRFCKDGFKIGEGGFGKVYKGKFRGGDVAIKKIECTSEDSRTLVENEVRLLHGKEHKNVAGLIAWCIEEQAFYLVYEYVKGCTLQEYLREHCLGPCQGWKQCLKIIQGIAEGIQFLHKNQIIHIDIKPQNLMLDSADENIKIIDFGFSRQVNWEGTHRSTNRIIGTRGYWAPEYCLYNKLSYKHDVYSFGIVVLEVITGQMHVDDSRGSQFHIPDYVKYMMANNRFEEAVEKRIKDDGWNEDDVKSAMAVAEMALRCADKDKEKRPHMDLVVRSLSIPSTRLENSDMFDPSNFS